MPGRDKTLNTISLTFPPVNIILLEQTPQVFAPIFDSRFMTAGCKCLVDIPISDIISLCSAQTTYRRTDRRAHIKSSILAIYNRVYREGELLYIHTTVCVSCVYGSPVCINGTFPDNATTRVICILHKLYCMSLMSSNQGFLSTRSKYIAQWEIRLENPEIINRANAFAIVVFPRHTQLSSNIYAGNKTKYIHVFTRTTAAVINKLY